MRDEHRIRRLARRIRPVKTSEPQPPAVEISVTPAGEPEPDWLDRIIFSPDEADPTDDGGGQAPEEASTRWYALGKRQPPTGPPAPDVRQPAPGVQVNINPPTPSPEDERARHSRHRRQLWIAYHGSAAATGWYIGLGPAMANLLTASGQSAPAVGIGLIICTGWPLAYLKPSDLPASLRPVITWASRIPPATAALVLALHAAHPLI
ncbi:hypothetical protein [Streptomyces sioyaensis]|uniref:hypothetical protein n=1 Tax=Streptomyces sioyaensis TaxID=67364 RepID=UPI0037939AD3